MAPLKGASANQQAVQAICKTGARIQLGGGIRTMQDIETWLSAGISRVILGTIALKNPKLVVKAAKAFPGHIAVGADARNGRIAAEGWLEDSDIEAIDLVAGLVAGFLR